MLGRPQNDEIIDDIADYVYNYKIQNAEAYRLSRYSVMDALGCAVEALRFPECTKLLGPPVPGMVVPFGARVPGTNFVLDPASAAFNLSTMIRWLDYNDALGGADGGHPSDNIGGVLALADYVSNCRIDRGQAPITIREALTAVIKAYEIQGRLSWANSLAELGLDNVAFLRASTAAVGTSILGGSRDQIANAVSNAFADGAPLKIYRQGNNTGSRKSWASGDAVGRGIMLALMAVKGEMGYPSVLTASQYGFYDALFRGKSFELPYPYGSYAIERSTFKLVPAGLHSQTAAECAFRLHALVRDRIADIASIEIRTHRNLMAIMDKRGPLSNFADRDHCVQYVIAVALLHGEISATDYTDEFAADPRIDELRSKMIITEEARFTEGYHNFEWRTNANAILVRLMDGSNLPEVEIEYGAGHPLRRAEGLPLIAAKFERHIVRRFPSNRASAITELCADQAKFENTPIDKFMGMFAV